ncbi:PREDICTED: transcription factor GAMYB-like isoform X2 [Camelina sativa]|uniref:Transcription factor GAMYB-like isoform X2 n=1 Tax=Camelina sativa TaxID=90675 RepID=A0ABM1RQR4_CAMSA|nr:PREDICTED: transcription factor GAMYB-like isoform X2 [Camelina sativa]
MKKRSSSSFTLSSETNGHLPGRTDNEIKNYWNTRMKRRQRAGLPLYPHDTQHQHDHQGIDDNDDDEFEFDLSSFQFQNQDLLHHNQQNMIQYTNSSNTSSSISSSSFSSSSSQPSKKMRPNDPLVSTNPGLNPIPDSPMNFQMFSLYNNSLDQNDSSHFGFSLPLSSSSSSNEFCNPNHILEYISENSDTSNYHKKDIDALSYSSLLLMGDHEVRPSSFPLGLENTVLELPSNQTTIDSFTSNPILDNGVHLEPPAGNSGLLDALLEESQALSRGGLFKDVRVSSSDLCKVQEERMKTDFENRLKDHLNSSDQPSLGANPNIHKYNEPTMVKATVDDDDDLLMSLLNNFPSTTTPLPDWYRMTEIQNEASYLAPPSGSILMGTYQGNSREEEPATVSPSSSVDPVASLGTCYWSNMPRIC